MPPPRSFGAQQGTESSDSESSDDEPPKHWLVKERDRRYKDEFTQGSKDLPGVLDQGRSLVRDGRFASVGDFMKQQMGWSQADCDKYLKPGGPNPVVGKVRRSGRAAFELHGGSSMTQGPAKEPFDTSSLYSKFMGTGYAIYVMDKRGRLYAAQHRVGIFHHSSFFSGGDVAGAGEMQVIGGVVKSITNKSGHYQPTEDEMVQVMRELAGRGVDLSAVEYVPIGLHFMGGINSKAPYPGGAAAFLTDHG